MIFRPIVDDTVRYTSLRAGDVAQAWRSYVKGLKTNVRGDIAFQGGGVTFAWIEK